MSDAFKKLTRAQLASPAAMEKRHYPFRNYRHAAETAVFPGCSFLSIYPRTTRQLQDLLAQRLGAGFVYDCCSQPVVDMGLHDEADSIAAGLEARLVKAGVRRVVSVCPNCHYRMKKTFTQVEIADVYQVLQEAGTAPGDAPQLEDLPVWQPCPDRRSDELLRSLSPYLPAKAHKLRCVPCCGLKGWGRIFDAETADRFATTLAEEGDVRTYCASCVMTVARHGGTRMRHAVVELLGTREEPDVAHSMANRAKGRFA